MQILRLSLRSTKVRNLRKVMSRIQILINFMKNADLAISWYVATTVRTARTLSYIEVKMLLTSLLKEC